MTATARAGRPDPAANRLLEILAVVLLGVATVGTAWCGFQAAQWNGEQGELLQESSDLRVEASRLFGLATQAIAYDATLVAQYAQVVVDGDEDLQRFYRETLFRADFLPILDRWEAEIEAGGGPPSRLLEDEEYLTEQMAPYDEATSRAEAVAEESDEAGRNGDEYVLVTVLLATALFFAGVTSSFRMRAARLMLLAASALAVAYSAAQLAELPVV